MYEPTWDLLGKRLSAYAEAAAISLAVLGMIRTGSQAEKQTASLG
ncbi:MAG: hypothetical protein QOE89_1128 [Pseudonocardiales bacterium]|nr:hypothetical protein [Pseudonocardiales bacterium]